VPLAKSASPFLVLLLLMPPAEIESTSSRLWLSARNLFAGEKRLVHWYNPNNSFAGNRRICGNPACEPGKHSVYITTWKTRLGEMPSGGVIAVEAEDWIGNVTR
jgi:hypothetical protein